MCLDKLTKTKIGITEGYKCFKVFGPQMHSLFYRMIDYDHGFPVNEWINNTNRKQIEVMPNFSCDCIPIIPGKPKEYIPQAFIQHYLTGFHFFETFEIAETYLYDIDPKPYHNVKILKIKTDQISASGIQNGLTCHVAQRMMIL